MVTPLGRLATGLRYSSILAKTAALGMWDKTASRRYLMESLGSVPGLSAKAAQFLSMRLGEEPNQNPVCLEPMPLEYVKARIERESPALHAELEQLAPATKVASLGQVHRATLRSGEEVAIKIQFPDLKAGMSEHLQLLRTVSKVGPPRKFQFEMDSILDFFSESLTAELDYRREAQQQMEAAKALPMGWPIRIAQVYPQFSSSTILVQSYEEAEDLANIRKSWSYEARSDMAQSLMVYALSALFGHGLLHTDPHPGNLGFRRVSGLSARYAHELVLYDFGSMMRIPQKERTLLLQLIRAYQDGGDTVPFDYLVALGFDPQKLLSTSHKLPAVLQKLFEPFCTEAAFDFAQWGLKEHFHRVLGDERWWFRSAGPAWFLMLMRSVQGLLHAVDELGCRVPVKHLLRELDLPLYPLPVPAMLAGLDPKSLGRLSDLAQALCILVCDSQGEELVRLELPARSVDEIEELIPTETLARMQEQKLDIQAMKQRVQSSAYHPQEIFALQTTDRSYRVWLR